MSDALNFLSALPPEAFSAGLDALQLSLDVVGLIPGLGEPFDAVNLAISAARQDFVDVSLGIISLIPVLGMATGGAKIIKRFRRLNRAIVVLSGPARVVFSRLSAAVSRIARGLRPSNVKDAIKQIREELRRLTEALRDTAVRRTDEAADSAGDAARRGDEGAEAAADGRKLGDPGDRAIDADDAPNRGCFLAGTPVHTGEGLLPIEQVEPGALVWAYNISFDRWELVPVIKALSHGHDGEMISICFEGECIRATSHQPFCAVRRIEQVTLASAHERRSGDAKAGAVHRWIEAHELKSGESLASRRDESVNVQSTQRHCERTTVFNLHVGRLSSYAVGNAGILVHNKPQRANRPQTKPTDAPYGTRAINEHPATKDIVHRIKANLREESVGADSYVGISPDGDVIVSNLDGTAENLGPWLSYAE